MIDELEQELLKRELERTSQHADPVIQRALGVLGQAINPIRVVGSDDIQGVYNNAGLQLSEQGLTSRKTNMGGFRLPNDPTIYINSGSKHYKAARDTGNLGAAIILAGILAHEQTHNTELGSEGERAARQIEADFLRSKLTGLNPYPRKAVEERLSIVDRSSRK